MRIFYTASSGETKFENVGPHVRLIEERDGLHSISKGAVYRDLMDKRDSMVFIWQDVTPPEGGVVTLDALRTIEVSKQHRQKIDISRLWYRGIRRFFTWFARIAWFSLFLAWLGFGAYIIYAVVMFYVH